MMRFAGAWALGLFSVCTCAVAQAPDADGLRFRDRYVEILRRNPYPDQAFERAYDAWFATGGIDAWIDELESGLETSTTVARDCVLLARIYARQFNPARALEQMEAARTSGETGPEFDRLMGALYFSAGRFRDAAAILEPIFSSAETPEDRLAVGRMLGSAQLRDNQRDRALEVWRRLAEGPSADIYTLLDVADIYAGNSLWPEHIAIHQRIADGSAGDPERRCRSLRAIGTANVRIENFPAAVASFQAALELVSPEHWMFGDIKDALIAAHDTAGDLEGLSGYLRARIDAAPNAIEFRMMLAETLVRLEQTGPAEAELRAILERAPANLQAHEALIRIHAEAGNAGEVVACYEALIAAHSAEPGYLRRLGEFYLGQGNAELAKDTWRRHVAAAASAEGHARVAEWFEQYGFPDDAAASYEQALAAAPHREWRFRLAELLEARGESGRAKALWVEGLDGPAADTAALLEAAAALRAHDHDADAEPLLRRAVELEPDNLETAAALAELLVRLGRPDDAIPLFTRMAGQTSNEFLREQGERGIFDLHRAKGDLGDVQARLEQVLEAAPDSPDALRKLAQFFELSRNAAKAVPLYERWAALDADNVEPLQALALAYASAHLPEKAIDSYTKLIAADRGRAAGYHRELVRLHQGMGRAEEALAAAEQIAALSPDDADARLELAAMYGEAGRTEESFDQFRRALQLRPGDAYILQQFGDALSGQERWGEATDAFRAILAGDSGRGARLEAVERLADVYQRQGRIEELAREFGDRVQTSPARLDVHEELAAVYRSAGDPARAVEVLENAAGDVEDTEAALRALLNEAYTAGRLEAAVRAYERLVALSASPTIHDLSRLGGSYAKLGRTEEAIAVWTRITSEHASDPEAWLTVAKAYEDEGMLEESFEARDRVLELTRFDHPLRFDLAVDLAAEQRYDEAVAELRTILDLGKDPAEAEREAAATGPRPAPARQPVLGGRSRRAARQWQGNFEQFRPEIVRTIVRFAQQSGTTPQALDGFRAKAKLGTDLAATNDLLVAYLAARDWEPAVAVVDELLAARPDDVTLLQQAAAIDQQLGRFDEAMKRMERVGELRPDQLTTVRYFMINAYIGKGRVDEADALVERTLAEFPDDPAVPVQCATMLLDGGRTDRAIALFRDALARGAKSPSNVRTQLAQSYRTAGDVPAAIETYIEIVLGQSTSPGNAGRPRNFQLYAPSLQPAGGRSISGVFGRLNIPADYVRVQALEQLGGLDSGGSTVAGALDRLIAAAAEGAASADDAARAAGYNSGMLAAAALVDARELERALDVLGPLASIAPQGVLDRDNLELMVLDGLERFDDMREVYAGLEDDRVVSQASIDQARFHLALVTDNFDEAETHVARLARDGGNANATLAALDQLRRAGQRKRCIRLIENELTGPSRSPRVMTMLAGYYAEERRFDDAAELARQAWVAGTSQRGTAAGGSKAALSSRRNQTRASDLQQWYGYASQAGKAPAMVREFEARRDGDPTNVAAYEDLIALYAMQGAQERVNATYRALIALRPDLIQPKLNLAQQYQAHGRIDEAIAVYEDALEQQPRQPINIGNSLLQLYRQANRTDDIKKLEERLAARATGPDELQNLAAYAMGRDDPGRAIELYARALALEPAYVHLHMQIAQCHEQLQHPAEAVAEYRKYLDAMYSRRSGQVDQHVIGKIADLEAAAGHLDALKAETEAALAANPADLRARAYRFHIARHEGRYADVLEEGARLIEIRPDASVVNHMVAMAEAQNDPATAIRLLETPPSGTARDNDRLARLYMKSGDPARAVEAWVRQAAEQGGYGYSQTFRNIAEAGYFEAACAFFRQSRGDLKRDRGALEQFDSVLVEYSARNAALQSMAFELVLTPGNPFYDTLARTMLQHEAGKPKAERLALAERLYTLAPENAGIAEEYANLLQANGDSARVVEIYRGVVARDGDNDDAIARLVSGLMGAGNAAEAEALARNRFESAPSPVSARTLAGCLAEQQKTAELEALFDGFASHPADVAEDLRATVLRHVLYRGNLEGLISRAWKEHPSAASFECLFAFLMDRNRRDEAASLMRDATARNIPAFSQENTHRIWRLALGGPR